MLFPRFTLAIVFITLFYTATGQTHKDSVSVDFRQSKIKLDTTYMQNGHAFRHIRQVVKQHQNNDSNLILRNINVVGAASPEGSVKFNQWLSKERAERLHGYMVDKMSLPDSLTSYTFLGRDWKGLRSRVISNKNVPYRDDVIALLDKIIEKCDNGEKESDDNLLQLKTLHNGIPYLYLYHNIFPYLRQADIVLTYRNAVPKIDGLPLHALDINREDIAINEVILENPRVDKPFYMALKTNMLADVLALPELGAEFYLGKNLSIVGNWMYGWWDNDRRHRYWRAYGGDIALRWWFGSAAKKKPLTGHHLGVYGGVVTYDFEFGGKGYMGGRPGHNLWDRCMKYCGFEYGYSLPIARRFNIDFTLGLGYLTGKYIEYVPADNFYVWEATKRKHWIGPTKLEVSLVWLIGHGNFNTKESKK